MSGYVASARIDRGSARLRAAGSGDRRATDDRPPPDAVDRRATADRRAHAAIAWIEAPAAEGPPGDLATRWTAFRERWSQLTFFLLDANSWR